jgi:outer membrane receptor for ferrienterochelin and colicins
MSFFLALTVSSSLLAATQSAVAADSASLPTPDPRRTAIAAGVWTSEDGSKVTYEASYFEAYQSVTAADMLRWVPGGAELIPNNRPGRNNENDKRGFGSGGDQILINGKRLSGKSNDIGSAMQRIQANVVARVEVIRGTTAGLDVRSEGTLINIVLNEEISGGAGSWQLHSGFYGDGPEYDGLLSYSNTRGRLNYLVSAQLGPYNRGNQIERFDEYFAAGTGELTERRDIEVPMLDESLVLNASAGWSFANGNLLNLNARVADRERDQNETTLVTVIGDPDTSVLANLSHENGLEWELGGDLEQRIGNGTLKTRVIYTREEEDESERVSLTSTDPGNVPAQSLVLTDELATETIIRSSYSWTLANGQNVEIGAEGAQNTLKKDVALFAVANDGTLTPVDLFNADSDVNEDRFEFFSTHFWQLRDDVALESAVNVEYSKIAQEGLDVDNSRSFTYVKPRFDLRWDLDDANQFRSSLERTVSQLDFGDFVAGFDGDNDQVDAGNPDLEPEKAWEFKLSYEHRMANDKGVVEAQVFFNDIEDHIDNIRVTDTSSAAGNIGDAENYGLTLRGSVRLANIGLEGAVLDASYTVQDSETTDPFTGRSREMSDKQRQEYKINFRHDIAAWRFNYNVEVEWNGKRYGNDINYREYSTSVNPRTHVGMQYRLTDRIVLWFDTRIVFDGHNRRTRERYDGNVADGNLLRTEVRNQYFRREHILGLRGQF